MSPRLIHIASGSLRRYRTMGAAGDPRNGGWKTFGVFKNQGDCVSFVATKGKNQPSGP